MPSFSGVPFFFLSVLTHFVVSFRLAVDSPAATAVAEAAGTKSPHGGQAKGEQMEKNIVLG